MKKKIFCIVGTRPEAIKMAPVIRRLQASRSLRPVVVATAQHRELLDRALADFGLCADLDFDLMRPEQVQPELLGKLITRLAAALERTRPAAVLAEGDTATVFAAAIAGYLTRIPFGHVEAGLRTYDLAAPFPEEGYRAMTARVTAWHFAPTAAARRNLRRENLPARAIHVTGNPVIDALHWIRRETKCPPWVAHLPWGWRRVLITVHRRESFGTPLVNIFRALRQLAARYPGVDWYYPVHPNPNVAGPARRILGGLPNLKLMAPFSYRETAHLLARCTLVVTDSGGLQEEAPALGVPVVCVRDRSERVEAVKAGTVCLAGTGTSRIVRQVSRILDHPAIWRRMAGRKNPYGDGTAAEKIVAVLERDLR